MTWSDILEHAGIACGADGFVRKTFRPAELVAAIMSPAGRRSDRLTVEPTGLRACFARLDRDPRPVRPVRQPRRQEPM